MFSSVSSVSRLGRLSVLNNLTHHVNTQAVARVSQSSRLLHSTSRKASASASFTFSQKVASTTRNTRMATLVLSLVASAFAISQVRHEEIYELTHHHHINISIMINHQHEIKVHGAD
jgi:hypothetical protein